MAPGALKALKGCLENLTWSLSIEMQYLNVISYLLADSVICLPCELEALSLHSIDRHVFGSSLNLVVWINYIGAYKEGDWRVGGSVFFRRIAYFFMTEFIMSLLFSGICLACVFVFFETKFDLVFFLVQRKAFLWSHRVVYISLDVANRKAGEQRWFTLSLDDARVFFCASS